MAARVKIPAYGLELVAGLMGSGKSYWAVWRIVQSLQTERRPIYTNLPIKWRTLRKYLRDRMGEEVANLVRPLTEEHWRAFLERQTQYAKFREQFKPRDGRPLEIDAETRTAMGLGQDDIYRIANSTIDQAFARLHGESVYEGDRANYIPAGAIIVIDEVQHWHPMSKQSKETEYLLSYLTMMRHHLHWVWVITQEAGRININFRLLADVVWRVFNLKHEKILWGLRLGHLGVTGLGYEKLTKDQYEDYNKRGRSDALKRFYIFPWMPHMKQYFRFYDSFTHLGSRRRLANEVKKMRKQAGLAESGETEKEQNNEATRDVEMEVIVKAMKWISGTVKMGLVAAIAAAVAAGVVGAGGGGDIAVENKGEAVAAGQEPEVNQVEDLTWPKYTGGNQQGVFVDGERLTIGMGTANGATVRSIAQDGGAIALERGDGIIWVWRLGDAEPTRIGDQQRVADLVASARGEVGRDAD